MKPVVILSSMAVLALTLSGCGHHAEPEKPGVQLSDEEQKLVAEQEYCAVHSDNRLGSMGKPYKVMVKGEPVFLCCDGCEKEALKDPDATLAKVAELKKKAKAK